MLQITNLDFHNSTDGIISLNPEEKNNIYVSIFAGCINSQADLNVLFSHALICSF